MAAYRTVADVDWLCWKPGMKATLLFVVEDGRILLIHKKRGLGAGRINGPGGRLESGETAEQAAVREVEEELLITPRDVRRSGELHFQFLDGLALHVTVFKAAGHTGEPQETDEATPLWVALDAIPYSRMWQDDPLWMPLMLSDQPFRGYFLFDGERLLDARVERLPRFSRSSRLPGTDENAPGWCR